MITGRAVKVCVDFLRGVSTAEREIRVYPDDALARYPAWLAQVGVQTRSVRWLRMDRAPVLSGRLPVISSPPSHRSLPSPEERTFS